MKQISVDDIKQLREQTGAGIADCRMALKESSGDFEKAKEWLKKQGLEKSEEKSDREVRAGIVETYSHGGKVGVIVELLCETDFVAKTDDFRSLAHEIALQIASMNPKDEEELLSQEYIRDPSLTIETLVKSTIGKLGENIRVGKFSRIELGRS